MGLSDRVHLTTAAGAFHARVVAARLAAEGIPVELRGLSDGPYPLPGEVEVFVLEPDAALAREILLADQVAEIFEPAMTRWRRPRRFLRRRAGT